MISRQFKPSISNSFFLFGPRGCGKTTFLESFFDAGESLFIDLLDNDTFDQFLLHPNRFETLIDQPEHINKRVIVDEVQKFPKILNTVHRQIQKRKRQFILTGSSSRKLKQAGNNLLAGRAWVYNLYPFTSYELGPQFNLKKALERGTLPEAYLSPDLNSCKEYLNAYVATYLQKEIQEEKWVRNLEPFRKFLWVAAQMNGKIINQAKMAEEIGVSDHTVAHYFEILDDTLLGLTLPAYHTSIRKAQKQAPKFYFIDPGIKRALERSISNELQAKTFAYGDAFEHFVILEIIKNASYKRYDWHFSFLRTKDDLEIDLIIDRPGDSKLLIEIKSKDTVSIKDTKSLQLLANDVDPQAESWLLSCDPLEQKFEKVKALHWQKALNLLFS